MPADPILVAWTRQADAELFSISLTLQVGGILISGQLVSAAAFWELLADSIAARGDGPPGDPESFANALMDMVDEDRSSNARPAQPSTAFLHLRDTRCWSGGVMFPGPDQSGVPWRVPLDTIAGWTIGRMG